MANTIKIKQSSVASRVPQASDLEQGELAINTNDEKLYTKNSSGTVVELGKRYDVVEDTTPQLGGDLDLNTNDITGTGDINITGSATVTGEFVGTHNGAVNFHAKNESGATLLKGKVVYINGVSGDKPTVDLADADGSGTMPAFGLVAADASNNSDVEVITFGTLIGLDTSSFSEGDILYVDTTAGGLTATKPTGESSLIQNIGIVQRSHATEGSVKVGGSGRTAATPNLNEGNVFIGDSNNTAEARALVANDITEINITSPVDEQFLRYNNSTQKWENTTVNTPQFYEQTTEPTSPNNGDTWYDDSEGRVFIRVTGNWIVIADTNIVLGYDGGDSDNATYTETLDAGNASTSSYDEEITGGSA